MATKKVASKPAGKTGAKAAASSAALVSVATELLKRGVSEAAAHTAAATALAAGAKTMSSMAAATAAATKAVVFSCSNPTCVVGLTAGTINIVFVGTGGATMPVGSFPLFWRVQGSGPFTVTAQGATLSSPIDSEAPDAGIRTLTVTP